MDLDDLLPRYFPAGIPDAGGIERLRVDLGLERDRGRRFALWSLLYMLGAAPDLDVAFEDPDDRDAARNFMDMADKAAQP